MGCGSRDTRTGQSLNIAIFGHETWPLAKVLEVVHILSFYPMGPNWAYFHSNWAVVSKIWADFQNCHIWAWNLAIGKVPGLAHTFSTSRGQNWAYFCFVGSGLQGMSRFLTLPYLGMKLGHWQKFQKLHIYTHATCTLFLPHGVKIELIFTLWAVVSKIEQFLALLSLINCYHYLH